VVKFLQRFSKPRHSVGVTIAVPHTRFSPTPTMTPEEIALKKGADAKAIGRPKSENPYTGALAAEWDKGYGA